MKLQSYSTFWQKLHRSAREKGIPLRVMFELTYRCNFKCPHCYVPENYRRYGELKTKEVFSILDQLKEIGCFYLGFTGNEPFVREDAMDIFWYAKRCGFEVIIYTNGSLIDETKADELAGLRPNKVDITIPAMSKSVFESVVGVAGYRDSVFKTIELLNKYGVNLGFKTCVLKENENEINEIEKFTNSLGALHRLDTMLSPRLDGDRKPYEYRGDLIKDRDRKNDVGNCQIVKLLNCSNEVKSLFKCGVGVSQAAITPLGELKMCLMIDYPKYKIYTSRITHYASRIKTMDLKKAWDRLKELVRDIKPDENYQCPMCELEPYCKWCPGKAWLYNKTFTCCESAKLLNC